MHSHNSIFDNGFIQVDKIHKIYYEQYGNPEGKPILFLHGGPGVVALHFRKDFDNKKYGVIFDQGSGNSLPYVEILQNI